MGNNHDRKKEIVRNPKTRNWLAFSFTLKETRQRHLIFYQKIVVFVWKHKFQSVARIITFPKKSGQWSVLIIIAIDAAEISSLDALLERVGQISSKASREKE